MFGDINLNFFNMNTYHVDTKNTKDEGTGSGFGNIMRDVVKAILIGNTMSPNFRTWENIQDDGSVGVRFNFDLPFRLDIPQNAVKEVVPLNEDNRFQGTPSFQTVPFVRNGNVVALFLAADASVEVEGDFSEFVKYPIPYTDMELEGRIVIGHLYIGIANSTLTESYAPFGVREGVLPAGMQVFLTYNRSQFSMRRVSGCSNPNPTAWSQVNPRTDREDAGI